jgi:hypothetical protein
MVTTAQMSLIALTPPRKLILPKIKQKAHFAEILLKKDFAHMALNANSHMELTN